MHLHKYCVSFQPSQGQKQVSDQAKFSVVSMGRVLTLGDGEAALSQRGCWQKDPYLESRHFRSLVLLVFSIKTCLMGFGAKRASIKNPRSFCGT